MIAWVFVWRFYIIPPQGRPHMERRLAAILVAAASDVMLLREGALAQVKAHREMNG